MKIYDYMCYDKKGVVLDRIDLQDIRLGKIVIAVNSDREKELVKILNMINNQGILEFNSEYQTYKNNKGVLPWSRLCTAERIFIVSYFANINKMNICITGAIKELSRDTLHLFFKLFGNSEYVDIMLPYRDEIFTEFLRYVIKEVR